MDDPPVAVLTPVDAGEAEGRYHRAEAEARRHVDAPPMSPNSHPCGAPPAKRTPAPDCAATALSVPARSQTSSGAEPRTRVGGASERWRSTTARSPLVLTAEQRRGS